MDALPVTLDPVTVESAVVCADARTVAPAFLEAAKPASAHGARLTVSFDRAGAGVRADVALILPTGRTERRDFSTRSASCAPLARAVFAWISVRMDEWSQARALEASAAVAGSAPPPAEAPRKAAPEIEALPMTSGLDAPFDSDREGRRVPDATGTELQVATTVVGDLARATLVGGTAGVAAAVGEVFVVRALGAAYSAAVAPTWAFAARVEGCRRMPGRYARHRGLAFDACVSAEVGVLDRELYGAVGPAAVLHGDLSRDLSLDLGGAVVVPIGASVAERPRAEGVPVAVRGDLGVSWRFR